MRGLIKSICFVLLLAFAVLSPSALMDASEPYQLGLQDPATPVMEGIINFHNHLMVFLVGTAGFVGWILYVVLTRFDSRYNASSSDFTHATVLEIVWTIVPAIILLIIAVPSFSLLYSTDESPDASVTLKVIGHQWYWSYEYSDYVDDAGGESLMFDSYMIPEEDLVSGSFRLLEVDNRVFLPVNTHVQVLITSADVLHSWAIPSFGVKVDAIPGRLSQVSLFIKRLGVFYGQCSEICGVNHGFMPIVVASMDVDAFVSWLAYRLDS